jgi:hypothetical protein
MVWIVRALAVAMVNLLHGSVCSYLPPLMIILRHVYALVSIVIMKMFSSMYLRYTFSDTRLRVNKKILENFACRCKIYMCQCIVA